MSILCGESSNHIDADNGSHRASDGEEHIEESDTNRGDKCATSERTRSPFMSLFGEVSIIRDFFLAAFQMDVIAYVNCCSAEYLFSGGEDATNSSSSAKHRSATNSSSHASLSGSQIASSSERSRKRRNKPLAVAVGFKYANDYDGRPIVITPGGRKSPNSVVMRSLLDPFQNARQKEDIDTKTPPRLPDLTVCNSPGDTASQNQVV